jgi:hypothetical protein
MLPTMPHVASFQLPPLKSPQPGCLWARPPKSSSVISKFAIKVQHPSSLAYVNDQVMTFRLEGESGGKSEKLQGVVLLSKLRDIMNRAIRDRSKRSAGVASTTTRLKTALGSGTSTSPGRVDTVNAETTGSSPEPVHIPWKDWSDAVSNQHSKSTTTLEPKFTQVVLFGHIKYGLGHRMRMVDLGFI